MPLRPPILNRHSLHNRIKILRKTDRRLSNFLNRKTYYLKPNYIPFADDVWISKTEVYLPANFQSKDREHQVMDLFRAASMFEEHRMFKKRFGLFYFLAWMGVRAVGLARFGLNKRIRQGWKQFLLRNRSHSVE